MPEIHVLDSLRVRFGDQVATPKTAMQRKVLATLILNVNHMVRTRTLMKELWGEWLPRTASATLQTYISQLRRFIADISDEPLDQVTSRVLLTEPGGYLLAAPAEMVDFLRFERQVSLGQAALASHELRLATRHLHDATTNWSGIVLGNVDYGDVARVQVRRLEQLWLSAIQQRFDLDLRLGRHQETLAELTGVAAANPLHEPLQGQLMSALFRSGQRVAALECYRSLRSRLVNQFGLEPTPYLERLHQYILSADVPTGDVGMSPSLAPLAAH